MVAGQPPFRGERDQAVIFAIANEQHEPLTAVRTGVPKELERIVDKCLAKSADERYQHITDLLVDLQACRRSMEPQSAAATPLPARANKTPLFVGIAALVVACLGLAWWFAGSRGPEPVPQYALRQITRDAGYTADPALSPDGKLLAYASDRDGDGVLDIWVRQLPGGQPTRLTDHQADDFAPSFSPDGTQIVFVSERGGGGIYVVPVLGSSARLIANVGNTHTNPRFSPDGAWISYRVESGVSSPATGSFSRIELASAAEGSTRTVETDLAFAAHPVWSPDGKYLLFQGAREPPATNSEAIDWWVVPVEGGEATELGISSLFEDMAIRLQGTPRMRPRPSVWLADEDRVLFSAAIGDGGENIWQVRLAPGTFEVGDLQRLTSGVGETMPSAAANGLLAFVSSTRDQDLWTLPLDANRAEVLGEPERVLETSSDELFPSISDDGRKLTYASDRNGNWDIWLLDLDTNENEPLTTSPREDIRGSISADGKRTAFVRSEKLNFESNDLYVMDLPPGKRTTSCRKHG